MAEKFKNINGDFEKIDKSGKGSGSDQDRQYNRRKKEITADFIVEKCRRLINEISSWGDEDSEINKVKRDTAEFLKYFEGESKLTRKKEREEKFLQENDGIITGMQEAFDRRLEELTAGNTATGSGGPEVTDEAQNTIDLEKERGSLASVDREAKQTIGEIRELGQSSDNLKGRVEGAEDKYREFREAGNNGQKKGEILDDLRAAEIELLDDTGGGPVVPGSMEEEKPGLRPEQNDLVAGRPGSRWHVAEMLDTDTDGKPRKLTRLEKEYWSIFEENKGEDPEAALRDLLKKAETEGGPEDAGLIKILQDNIRDIESDKAEKSEQEERIKKDGEEIIGKLKPLLYKGESEQGDSGEIRYTETDIPYEEAAEKPAVAEKENVGQGERGRKAELAKEGPEPPSGSVPAIKTVEQPIPERRGPEPVDPGKRRDRKRTMSAETKGNIEKSDVYKAYRQYRHDIWEALKKYPDRERAEVLADKMREITRPSVFSVEEIEKMNKELDPFLSDLLSELKRPETITRAAAKAVLEPKKGKYHYSELNAETPEEADKKFAAKAKEVWKDFATHGKLSFDKRSGKVKLVEKSDFDGMVSLKLLGLAGLDINGIEYIPPGEHAPGKTTVDSGNKYGVFRLPDGSVIIDHHGPDARADTSSAEMTYKTLIDLGLLEGKDYLDKLVQFVTAVDNMTYDLPDGYFGNSAKTVLGIYRHIDADNFDKLVKFFEDGRDPREVLNKKDLEPYGFEKYSSYQQEILDNSKKELQRMERNGLIVNLGKYGKTAIDIDKQVEAGYDAARAYGCDSYIIWSPETESFFITADKSLTLKLGQGMKVRDRMWIKPMGGDEKLKLTLSEVLETMSGRPQFGGTVIRETKQGKQPVPNELRNFLNQEKHQKQIEKSRAEGNKSAEDKTDNYVRARYHFLISKYKDKPLALRSNLQDLNKDIGEFGFTDQVILKNIAGHLRRCEAEARGKIKILVKTIFNTVTGNRRKIPRDLRAKIEGTIRKNWDDSLTLAGGLTRDDMKTAIAEADRRVVYMLKAQYNEIVGSNDGPEKRISDLERYISKIDESGYELDDVRRAATAEIKRLNNESTNKKNQVPSPADSAPEEAGSDKNMGFEKTENISEGEREPEGNLEGAPAGANIDDPGNPDNVGLAGEVILEEVQPGEAAEEIQTEATEDHPGEPDKSAAVGTEIETENSVYRREYDEIMQETNGTKRRFRLRMLFNKMPEEELSEEDNALKDRIKEEIDNLKETEESIDPNDIKIPMGGEGKADYKTDKEPPVLSGESRNEQQPDNTKQSQFETAEYEKTAATRADEKLDQSRAFEQIKAEEVATEEGGRFSGEVSGKFAEMNITENDLKRVAGFENLKEEQQLLVFNNLKQLALDRIQEEAASEIREKTARSGWGGKIWKNMKKHFSIAKAEKLKAEEITRGGIAVHKDAIEELVRGINYFGTDVRKKDGRLEINFLTGLDNLTEEQQAQVDKFNEIATELSYTPDEWAYESAKKGEQRKYDRTQEQYQRARHEIIGLLESVKEAAVSARVAGYERRHMGAEEVKKIREQVEREVLLDMNRIDSHVKFNQFLNTNPEVEKRLQKIQSKWFWTKAAKDTFTERGVYMLGGGLSRHFAIKALAVPGAAVVAPLAAVMGGTIGRVRGHAYLKEQEKNARRGIRDVKRNEKGDIIRNKEIKKFSEARQVADKIHEFINKLAPDSGLDDKKRKTYEKSLVLRTEWLADKLDKGLIDFGAKEDRLARRYELLDALCQGRARMKGTRLEDLSDKFDMVKRFEHGIESRDLAADKRKSKHLNKQMMWGAGFGFGFASLGVGIRYGAGAGYEWLHDLVSDKWVDRLSILKEWRSRFPQLKLSDKQLEGVARNHKGEELINFMHGEMKKNGIETIHTELDPTSPPERVTAAVGGDAAPGKAGTVPDTGTQKPTTVITENQPEPATTGKTAPPTVAEAVEAAHGLKSNFTLELGQGKVPAELERTFHMMSTDAMKDVLGPDQLFGEEEAAKSLNVAANLVKLAEGHKTAGIGADKVKDIFAWDADAHKLEIKDYGKFNDLVKQLHTHADKLWTDGKLQTGAAAYLDDIKQGTWEKIIHAEGLEEQISGHDAVTPDAIKDFADSDMVAAAERPPEPSFSGSAAEWSALDSKLHNTKAFLNQYGLDVRHPLGGTWTDQHATWVEVVGQDGHIVRRIPFTEGGGISGFVDKIDDSVHEFITNKVNYAEKLLTGHHNLLERGIDFNEMQQANMDVFGDKWILDEQVRVWNEHPNFTAGQMKEIFSLADTLEKLSFIDKHAELITAPVKLRNIFNIAEVYPSHHTLDLDYISSHHDFISKVGNEEAQRRLLEILRAGSGSAADSSAADLLKLAEVDQHELFTERLRGVAVETLKTGSEGFKLHYDIKGGFDFDVIFHADGTAKVDGPPGWDSEYDSLRELDKILKRPLEALREMRK